MYTCACWFRNWIHIKFSNINLMLNRESNLVICRYGIPLGVFNLISHEWACRMSEIWSWTRVRREIPYLQAPMYCFVYYINILMSKFWMIFLKVSKDFPNFFQKPLTNVSAHFGTFFKDSRRLRMTTEEDPKITPTNLNVIKNDLHLWGCHIFTCDDIILCCQFDTVQSCISLVPI